MCTLAQGLLFWLVYFRYRTEVSEDNRARSNRQGTTGDGSGIGRIETCSRCTGCICRCTGASQLSTRIHLIKLGQSENSVVILLSGYSFVSLRHETMASITDSIS